MRITAPTGRLVFVIPFRNRLFGGPPSMPQFTTLPSRPLTSTQIHECGLISSTFVTVPSRLIGLFSSNAAANAWCASMATAARSRIRTPITTPSLIRIAFLPFVPRVPGVPRVQLLTVEIPIHHVFDERHAIEVDQLHVRLHAAVQGKPDLPWTREDLRI